jgi:hypothetical protein
MVVISSRTGRLLIGVMLATGTSRALAHGEEVLLSIGLQVLSFFGCVLAIGFSKRFERHRTAAAIGASVGLLTFFWPFSFIRYLDNQTLINVASLLSCPLFMSGAYYLASWRKARASVRNST